MCEKKGRHVPRGRRGGTCDQGYCKRKFSTILRKRPRLRTAKENSLLRELRESARKCAKLRETSKGWQLSIPGATNGFVKKTICSIFLAIRTIIVHNDAEGKTSYILQVCTS